MRLYDISRPLTPTIAVWPGDTPFTLEINARLSDGASVNLSSLRLSAHTGAHADAPWHFAAAGLTIDQVPLEAYWGLAQVVTVTRPAGGLTPADFAAYDLSRAPRLLVRSSASGRPLTEFPDAFVYPTSDLADFLARQGVILYGSDAPSMDAADSHQLPGHHALWRNGIAILEGLDLSQPPDGLYELVALPLRLVGGDGSPVRAALRALL